jgi:hypothetical protein
MPDLPTLTAEDFDPWALATPEQLLAFCVKLGVSGSDIGRWLRVPPSSVSMWLSGTRLVPRKHIPALRERTRLAFDQNAELMTKAVALAPREDLRHALRRDFDTLYLEWKTQVLHDAGTLWRVQQREYETLGAVVHKPQYTRADIETFTLVAANMAQRMELMVQLGGEAPDPGQALLDQLTQGHEAAHPTPPDADD